MPNIKSAFKAFKPFGKMMRNKVAKGFTINNLKSTIQHNLSKGSKIGLKQAGIGTKGQLKERLLGVNVGLVDRNFSPLTAGAGHTSNRLGKTIGRKIWDMTGRNYAGQAVVGATAMAGIAIMNGGMSQAQDIMIERHMKDARFNSRVMGRTGIGKTSGASPLNLGNNIGLSLAMSKNRHGH